ncbi:hypothetical protein CH281_12180 [Rhodococcus sp. 06-221-2]|nr:hypothetical protein CH281_12180 [Rhodococcus sp. 06-221-2]
MDEAHFAIWAGSDLDAVTCSPNHRALRSAGTEPPSQELLMALSMLDNMDEMSFTGHSHP